MLCKEALVYEAYQAETEAPMLETEALVGLEASSRLRAHPCIKLKHRYINVCSMRSRTSIPFRLIIYVVHDVIYALLLMNSIE